MKSRYFGHLVRYDEHVMQNFLFVVFVTPSDELEGLSTDAPAWLISVEAASSTGGGVSA